MKRKITVFVIIFLLVFPGLALAYGDGLYINSFYAISSYPDRYYGSISDQAALGWGEVRSKNGNIYFTQKRYEEDSSTQYDYGVPLGVAEVVNLVKELKSSGTRLKLSVYLDNEEILKKILTDPEIQNKIINEITGDLKIKYYDYTKNNGEYLSSYITDGSGNYIEYDGIIIDFEGLKTASFKDKFNVFIDKLRQKLPKEKTLTVCIPPKMGDPDKGEKIQYYYAYDYAHLGLVCDEVILMAHDFEHADANLKYRISASAPYMLVENAVKNAKKDIPANKILLAISIKNVQWRKGYTESFKPSYKQVVDAVEGNNRDEKVVEVTSPELRYDDTLKVGHVSLKREIIYNNVVNTVEDDFYFENSRSIEDKIGIVKKYGLKGVSVWRLGSAYSRETDENFAYEVFDPIFKYRMFDINKDGKINNQDLDAAMVSYRSKPGDTTWKKELDFDNNGIINIYDIARMTKYMN